MFSRKKDRVFRRVTFRLTLWYTVLFAVLSLASFGLVYFVLSSNLTRRMDKDLLEDLKEYEELYVEEGTGAVKSEFQIEAESEGVDRVFLILLSPKLEIDASSELRYWKGIVFAPMELKRLKAGQSLRRTVSAPIIEHKARVVYTRLDDGSIVGVGESLEADEELIATYRSVFLAAGSAMLVFGALLGWLLARRAMAGVKRVTQTALNIGGGNLADRVPVGGEGEEIRNLALAFNGMLERIQILVTEMREVANNVAHDLRSPITRIRGAAEASLTGGQNIDEYHRVAGLVIEESDLLMEMINTMLEIAETNSGVAELAEEIVSPAEIILNACELFQPVAEDKGVRIEVDVPQEPLRIKGDNRRLQRVVSNLLDNAIKFTPSGGSIAVSAKSDQDGVIVKVVDSGVGIDKADLPRIFDRFYRAEPSRSALGNGLGLSLAQAIIRAHGGEISVESSPEKGSTFSIFLPSESSVR